VEDDSQTGVTEPKCHELQRKAAIEGWETLRARFLEVSTESVINFFHIVEKWEVCNLLTT